MIKPTFPIDEKERLEALLVYGLLDTLAEKDYDTITALASSICEVPISLVTLLDVDRNFLKSHHGIPFNESPRDISFCGHAILDESSIFIIPDARKDIRFCDNPLVLEQNAVFYAGVPLVTSEGYPLGTLCIFDDKPRDLNVVQKECLIMLGYQVMNLFEARKKNKELIIVRDELNEKNEELKNFAGMISHDMKMPLANIIVTADILKAKYGLKLDGQADIYLGYLKKSSLTLSDYITGLLAYYESDKIFKNDYESFNLQYLLEDIVDLLDINMECEINFPDEDIELNCNRAALEQILLNLIGNSLKYNDKDKIIIDIACNQVKNKYLFKITDNGMGIPKEKQLEIFNLFSIVGNLDRNGNKGHGIGLSTVKKLIANLGGNISVDSELGKGTAFNFFIVSK